MVAKVMRLDARNVWLVARVAWWLSKSSLLRAARWALLGRPDEAPTTMLPLSTTNRNRKGK